MGQTAWRDGTGQVQYLNYGTNPNGGGPQQYQQLTEK